MTAENTQDGTFLHALHAKYCDEVPLEAIKFGNNKILQVLSAGRLEKIRSIQKNLTHLNYINVSDSNISKCGSIDSKDVQLRGVVVLDLSLNQIASWKTVAEIVGLTCQLEELILTANPLPIPTEIDQDHFEQIALSKLKTIVLGRLSLDWSAITRCLALFPNVRELNVLGNNVTTIDIPGQSLQKLKCLILANNPVHNWKDICRLGTLKQLENLDLSNCQITSIRFDDCDHRKKTTLFSSLKALDLLNNQISDWRSAAELNKLPSLKSLVLKKNPLYNSSKYDHNFNFILARIESLVKLDKEFVKPAMREDAEKYYLRLVYPAFLHANDEASKADFFNENPCFERILSKYGEPVIAKKLDKVERIKQNYLNLNIYDEESKKRITKQFPTTTKVSSLKFILRRLLNIKMGQDFVLQISSQDYLEEMNDRDDVSIYRFEDDHVIHVKRI